jgi:hypothetical protein
MRPHDLLALMAGALLAVAFARQPAAAAAAGSGAEGLVKCAEPLPEFSLGPASSPTAGQKATLCSCIWGALAANERQVAEKIVANRQSELSSIELRAFPSRFGNALERCGSVQR